jgi:hypothetical protein
MESWYGVVAHACNPSTPEAEEGVSKGGSQPGLHRQTMFQKPKANLKVLWWR